MVLLCLRSTLTDTNLPSPAHILYSRQPRTNLPPLSIHTRDRETARKFLQSQRQRVRTEYYNGSAKDAPPPLSVPPRLTPAVAPANESPTSVQPYPRPRNCKKTPPTSKATSSEGGPTSHLLPRFSVLDSPVSVQPHPRPRNYRNTPPILVKSSERVPRQEGQGLQPHPRPPPPSHPQWTTDPEA